MIEKLKALIKKWEDEAKYLNNPWDDERDRYAGQTYSECAEKLKEVLAAKSAVEADLELLAAMVENLENRLFELGEMQNAPCFVCGYNGPGYFQPDKHPCAERHHKLCR